MWVKFSLVLKTVTLHLFKTLIVFMFITKCVCVCVCGGTGTIMNDISV